MSDGPASDGPASGGSARGGSASGAGACGPAASRACTPRGGGRHRPLQGQLFRWFVGTMLAAGGMVALLSWAFGSGEGYRRDAERLRALASVRFAEAWGRADEREALRADVSRALELDVRLYDPEGALVGGPEGACKHVVRVPVVARDGERLGRVELCTDGRGGFSLRGVALAGLALGLVWLGAGLVARRISRPLGALARTARAIGDGELSARVELGRKAAAEVQVVADAVNDMATRIQRQLASERELMATVSHELRTPLARARLLLELARDAPTDAARAAHAASLEGELEELDALVGELLARSRLDFTAIDKRPLDAAALATRAVERAGVDPTRLVVDADERRFEGDPTLVARALANLIENAERHAGGAVEVRVSARDEGGRVLVFEVDDDGPGFSLDEAERLFEPFVRVERDGARAAEGERPLSLGLGLALVRRIAEAHGGRAYAETREGGGGRVGFTVGA